MNDFHLVKRFSFADYFGAQHAEEVDLSQFAGKDIYIAFRVCSERMQKRRISSTWNISLPKPVMLS